MACASAQMVSHVWNVHITDRPRSERYRLALFIFIICNVCFKHSIETMLLSLNPIKTIRNGKYRHVDSHTRDVESLSCKIFQNYMRTFASIQSEYAAFENKNKGC
jgi:hypothetical protein